MLKIEVTKTYIKRVTGSKGDNVGKTFDIPMCECYAHLPGEKYPVKVEFSIPRDGTPPAVGEYTLAPESLYVDGFGQLQVRRSLTLVPARK